MYRTNDPAGYYHAKPPGKKPPHWVVVALAISIGISLLWHLVDWLRT